MKKGTRKYNRRCKQIVSSSLQIDILEHGIKRNTRSKKQITCPQNGIKVEQKWITDTDQDNELFIDAYVILAIGNKTTSYKAVLKHQIDTRCKENTLSHDAYFNVEQ